MEFAFIRSVDFECVVVWDSMRAKKIETIKMELKLNMQKSL